MKNELNTEKDMNQNATRRASQKRVYSTPQIKSYGNAVEITLGGGGPGLDGSTGKSHNH
jgi:hypothetical protein